MGVCTSKRSLHGKVTLITGANAGIGFETAKDFARRGAKVYMACRNMVKADEACDLIRRETNNQNVFTMLVDLSSLESVRSFCKNFMALESKLDILVNNAGIAETQKIITQEGFEKHLVTNHLGPFLLTNILIELLKKSDEARIVIVSSEGHKYTNDVNFDNLNSEKGYEKRKIYIKTKLYNMLFMKELNSRIIEGKYDNMKTNALHPGAVKTQIFNNAKKLPIYNIVITASEFFFKTSREGAQTTIHLAVSDEVKNESGFYYSDCKKASYNRLADDKALCKKFWDVSADLVKLLPSEYNL